MSVNPTNKKSLIIGIIIGLTLALLISFIVMSSMMNKLHSPTTVEAKEEEPLYWVAPMDANFKKDKPGKSPMGMDLVPVYDDGGAGPDEGAGTIRISSNVENNLGVRVAKAEIKPLNSIINTVGYVTYNEEQLVNVHSRVQGWIEKLYVSAVGDQVTKGQALYDIYSPELVNAQEEFLLALDRKNNRLISAAQNRLAALHLPQKAIEKLRATREIQQNVTFYAIQSGVVESLSVRAGVFVKPETMMLSIIDLSQVWVKAEVFERQASLLAMGNDVVMTLDYLPNKEWQGKIDHIHPMINPKTRTAIARLRFDNTNNELKPNMFGQITIQTSGNESTLLIPKEALIKTGKQNRVVLALGEGNYKSIEVKVGRYNENSVEILEGLAEGENVVSSAQFLLDSESSKTSDFKRMEPENIEEEIYEPSSVWVNAQVESTMADHRMLTLIHDPIPEWSWPEMTMDFTAIDAVDFSQLTEGRHVRVKISKKVTGGYQVIDIDVSDTEMLDQQMSDDLMPNDKSVIDHSHH
ncbi:efflux RND transporter periplasmic adaptor subunit [Colwellia sp. 6_MG-2023]|uniref:efflux RND transporter periplasmic adaptor subunit n=1 Tax=Colwellia sp. 6_MG-2023 TaxID=3062676 RepID=UPI0026E137A3|nr:efflux RND transporter periplasmic adaptor subunit [Colwellia sp. 6_MG-2023]MDO6489192.1 efflux RND transporter periplasmic adaptor subunit [Colwellia sp. 6_MG-2023]